MIDASLGSLAVVVVGLALGLALARRRRDDAGFVAAAFVAAFGLRVLSALAIHGAELALGGSGALFQDDFTYDLVAGQLVRIGRGEPIAVFLGHQHLLNDTYVYTLALLYLVIGHDPLAGKLLSALFGALSVLVAYDLAARLGGRLAGRLTALAMAGFPSLVLWTSLTLKEGFVLLLSLLLLRAIALAARPGQPLQVEGLTWLGVVAVLLGSLRLPAMAVLSALMPVAALARALAQPGALRRHPRAVAGALVLVVVGAGAVLLSPPGRLYLDPDSLERLPTIIQFKRLVMGERGSTSLLSSEERDRQVATANPAGIRAVLGYVPEGVRDALLAPFPWSAHGWKEGLLALEMVAWYVLLAFALAGVARLARDRRAEALILVAYLVGNLFILGLFDTNVGTLVRHRTTLYAAAFPLAAVGLAALIERRVKGEG
ncbi:MAG: hypothetical protein HY690_09410 [Chloroflexi bacterium]|nr:hypothetical protein [Chloroflexota bacterium]